MKRFASEQDSTSTDVWRLEADDLARFPGSSNGGHAEDLLLGGGSSRRRRLNEEEENHACFLEQIEGDAELHFPFESTPGGLIGSGRNDNGPGGSSSGAGARGVSPYSYGDFHAADRKNDVADLRDSRRVLERDMHAQASLERLEEENSSLRAITRYLIHERKELRRKADTAAKRNQNLNNLLQVIKWSLLQGGANACGVSGSRSLSSVGFMASGAGRSPTMGEVDLLVGE